MDEPAQQSAESGQEAHAATTAAEKECSVDEAETDTERKVAVIVMPGYAESSAGRTETLLKQIAQAQREGVPVSSIYCPPILSDSGGEERAVSGKKGKKRGRPPKPVELGPDGQPIKRKRGRPRIHPKPEPLLAPDGSPVKRKRGRPRKNPLPEVAVVAVPPPEEGPVKRRVGRPRKNPLPERQNVGAGVKETQDDSLPLPGSSGEAAATTDQQLSANGVVSAPSSSSIGGTSETPVKRKRGRPRKNPLPVSPAQAQTTSAGVPVKRGRGRPRKHPVEGGAAPPPSTGVPGKQKRGRPRKNPLPNEAPPAKKRRGRPPKVQVAPSAAVAEIPELQLEHEEEEEEEEEVAVDTSSQEESPNKFLSITFSDASSDSEWSGAAKVSELASRVATGSMSEEPLATTSGEGGGGGEGKPEDSSDESSYISDV